MTSKGTFKSASEDSQQANPHYRASSSLSCLDTVPAQHVGMADGPAGIDIDVRLGSRRIGGRRVSLYTSGRVARQADSAEAPIPTDSPLRDCLIPKK
ncbi:MAG: hypothetical protein ACR2OX_06045 [Methyloligellaceae bacterium]